MNSEHKPKLTQIGLIGYGSLGRLLAPHLSRFYKTYIYDPELLQNTNELPVNCQYLPLNQLVARCEIVILAVNLNVLESVVKSIALQLRPGTMVVDVCSVKLKPVALMKKHLPHDVEILGTHPLFGPQSATIEPDGISGHQIILCPVRVDNLSSIVRFLKKLHLDVTIMTADEHDRSMAQIHGLTFFLARGLMKMNLPSPDLATPSYSKLLSLANLERHHSQELFETIELGNPYAAAVRQQMIDVLTQLNEDTQT